MRVWKRDQQKYCGLSQEDLHSSEDYERSWQHRSAGPAETRSVCSYKEGLKPLRQGVVCHQQDKAPAFLCYRGLEVVVCPCLEQVPIGLDGIADKVVGEEWKDCERMICLREDHCRVVLIYTNKRGLCSGVKCLENGLKRDSVIGCSREWVRFVGKCFKMFGQKKEGMNCNRNAREN